MKPLIDEQMHKLNPPAVIATCGVCGDPFAIVTPVGAICVNCGAEGKRVA